MIKKICNEFLDILLRSGLGMGIIIFLFFIVLFVGAFRYRSSQGWDIIQETKNKEQKTELNSSLFSKPITYWYVGRRFGK